MPSLKDIRTRIDSTKNTQQITRAMKMTSAAKLRRAQNNITNLRPYAKTILSVIADIAATQRVEHPLLQAKENPQKVLLVVLTSDRGLCGAFNTNVSKAAYLYFRQQNGKVEALDFLFVGRKASDYFKRREIKGVDTILNLAKDIRYDYAAKVADRLIELYEAGSYDEIRIVYNEFKSPIQQTVITERLLPVDIQNAGSLKEGTGFPVDMIFEPEPEKIIDALLKKHFAVQVYRCMSESVASEHGARMTAMENATKNAGEMISGLTLTYNKLRQSSITTELIEITSGAEALKG